MKLTVSALHIYPVKSLAGIPLTQSKVEARGLQYDRRWMLVNDSGRFVSQREFPEMALLQPSIANGRMKITHKQGKVTPFTFPLDEYSQNTIDTTTWDDACPAIEVSSEASHWFSNTLNTHCRLVYMPDSSIRPADPRYAITTEDKVSFADGYPILMFDEASIDLLSEKAGQAIPADRFRGNLIIKGGHAHIEDELKVFEINEQTYHGIKPCSRCIMTTIDQDQGKSGGNEPLKTLASYRKVNHKIKFGQNVIPPTEGSIAVGDIIHVKEMIEPITF